MEVDEFTYDDENFIPDEICEKYCRISCLKYTTEKQVYVIKDKLSGDKQILKCASGEGALFLETEYNFLKEYDFEFLAKSVWGKQIGDTFYLIREYFEGETLESYVEKRGCLEISEALSIIENIGKSIEQLHSHQPPILHRDIKPQNFLRTIAGEYKIIDMETMKYYNASSDFDTVIIGTRMTAAPEQFGYHQSSVETDIYGLGMLLVFLLTGDYSLKDKNLKQIPFFLRKIIEKSTEFDPQKRYKNVNVFCREISFYRRYRMRRSDVKIGIFILLGVLIVGGLASIVDRINVPDENAVNENANINASITFVNPRIEWAVRQYLGKSSDEAIMADELAEIKTLLLAGDKIYDDWDLYDEYYKGKWYEFNEMNEPLEEFLLDDLQYFTGLEELALDLQNLDILDGIEALPLKKISVSHNNIEDVTGLKNIETLEFIRISCNPAQSLEGFENLKKVEYLNLSDTEIDDLSPIKNCPIEELNCSYTYVTDFEFLKSHPDLRILRLSGAGEETIEYINTLVNLRELTIMQCEISSLEQIANLKNLISLDLTNCTYLKSLEGIDVFKKLEYVAIASTGISDITPIKNLSNLYTFEPSYAPITDFTPLLECPMFNCMYIDKELAVIAKEQLKEKYVIYNIID